MKVEKIIYSKVFNLGNYQNEKIGIEISIQDGDDPVKCHMEAVKYVERANKFQSLVPRYMEAKKVVADRMRYTGYQIDQAAEIIKEFETDFKDFIAAYSSDQLKEIEEKRTVDTEAEF